MHPFTVVDVLETFICCILAVSVANKTIGSASYTYVGPLPPQFDSLSGQCKAVFLFMFL